MNWDLAGAVSGLVILLVIVIFTIWLLWVTFRARHWYWPWRVVSGVVGFVLLLFLVMVGILWEHAIEDARGMRMMGCRSNVMQIHLALLMYASDNDDRAPQAHWVDGIAGYVGGDDAHRCPVSDAQFAYTMNEAFLGAFYPDPLRVNVPVLFDGPGGKNSVWPAGVAQYRHEGERAHFLFGDGWVQALKAGETRGR